ncbi:hypothetical protein Tco_0795090 [Tanacetum coccineum]
MDIYSLYNISLFIVIRCRILSGGVVGTCQNLCGGKYNGNRFHHGIAPDTLLKIQRYSFSLPADIHPPVQRRFKHGLIQVFHSSMVLLSEDGKGCGDDSVLVSKDNSVDEDCNVCEDASAGLSKDEIVNDKLVDEDCNVCEDASAGLSKDNVVNEKSVGNND